MSEYMKIKTKSKYPYFNKIGRPSNLEKFVLLKINHLLNDGKISESGIEQWKKNNGSPTNLKELKYMYHFLTGEDAKVPKNKYYTGNLTPTPDVSNFLETTICGKSKVAFKKEEPIKHSLSLKKITKEFCIADAKKYKTKKEWREKRSAIYQYAYKKGWYNECTAHMVSFDNSRTKEECIEDARKYKTLKEWREKRSAIYQYAYKKGWYNECTAHMVSFDNRRTKEECIEDARKYKTLKEWRENSRKIHDYAYRKGWFKECTTHMVAVNMGRLMARKEDCIADARKYKTKKEWRENSRKIHDYAYRKGWFKECTAHMVTLKTGRLMATKEDCIADARKYKTKKEWRENSRTIYDYAYRKGWLKECSVQIVTCENEKKSSSLTKQDIIKPSKKGGVVPKNKHIISESTPKPASELEKKFYTPKKCKEFSSNKSEIYFDILKNGEHIISLYFSDNKKSTNWLLKSIQAFDSEHPKTNEDSVVDAEVNNSTINSDLKNKKSGNSFFEKIKRFFSNKSFML